MTITANDEPTEIEADVDKRFSSIVVNLPVQQTGTGTPSPLNPRPFAKWTDVSLYVSDAETADEPTLTIELPTPMYGGKIDMVRGEIATTYNSKESGTDWEMTEEGQFRCQVSAYNNGDETSTNVADLYAVHYETVSNKDAYDATDDLTCGLATIDGTTYLYVNDAQYTTLESFATNIADEVFVFRAHIPMSDVTDPHIVYLPEGTSYVWAEGAYYVETVSGTPPLSLPNSLGKPLKAWSVELSPYQDLHGYDAPWPAGGGKNKFDYTAYQQFKVENGITFTVNTDGTVKANGTSTTQSQIYWRISQDVAVTLAGYVIDVFQSEVSGVTAILEEAGGDYTQYAMQTGGTGETISSTIADSERGANFIIRVAPGTTLNNVVFYPMIRLANSTHDYAPYSNICPILGTDKLTITTAGKNLFPMNISFSGTGYANRWLVGQHPELIPFLKALNDLRGQKVAYSVYTEGTTTGAPIGNIRLYQGDTQVFNCYPNSYTTVNTAYDYTLVDTVTIYGSNSGESVFKDLMICIGDTPQPYVPYQPIVTTVITLPQTVYTGTIGSEGGESRWAEVDLGTLTWFTSAPYKTAVLPLAKKPSSSTDVANMLAEKYHVVARNSINNVNDIAIDTNGTLFVRTSETPSGKLVYELATPTTFAVPSATIPTPTGSATTWATAEDGTVDGMEVQYIRIAEQEA